MKNRKTEKQKNRKTEKQKNRKMVFTLLLSMFIFSCAGQVDISSEKVLEKDKEYVAKTNVGKTLKKYSDLQKDAVSNIISTAQECYDLIAISTLAPQPENINGSSRSIVRSSNVYKPEISLEDIGSFFPDKTTRELKLIDSSYSRSGGVTTDVIVIMTEEQVKLIEEMEQKINKIIEDYKESLIVTAPKIATACTFDFVEASQDGKNIVIGGDMVYDPSSFQGALIVEMLTARANGISDAEIKQDLINLGIALPEESTSRGHYKKYTSLYPFGVIKYKFRNISSEHEAAMKTAMSDWSNRTGFIKFESAVDTFWQNAWQGADMETVLNIYDANLDGAWGESYVGNIGTNTLRLQKEGLYGEQLIRTTRHELGHVIGLQHEHQRWDRDQYVENVGGCDMSGSNYVKLNRYHSWWGAFEWKWEQIDSWKVYYWETKWVGAACWQGGHYESVLKYKWEPIYGYKSYWVPDQVSVTPTSYDVRSIMHYTNCFKLKKPMSGLATGHTLMLKDCMYITHSDVSTVKNLYGR